MKTYAITIKPISGFGTPLKGDTLFGNVCWQAVYDKNLFGCTIDELLENYGEKPFLILSSAYPSFMENDNTYYALKRPDVPFDKLFNLQIIEKKEIIKKRKELKQKKWMRIKENSKIETLNQLKYLNDDELFELIKNSSSEETQKESKKRRMQGIIKKISQFHNTINRLTNSTGDGRFSPYEVEQEVYFPETELVIFAGIDDTRINIEQVENALKKIGDFGFGKDASTGLGKFDVCGYEEINLLDMGNKEANCFYTLSPCVPENELYEKTFFSPFVRFGKHGDVFAKSKNPFKNPIIMSDEGAIFFPKNKEQLKEKIYIGKKITGLSLTEPKTVAQGYSLCISMRLEV